MAWTVGLKIDLYYVAYLYACGVIRDQHRESRHEQMRADLKNLNGAEYKNHRVYRKSIE